MTNVHWPRPVGPPTQVTLEGNAWRTPAPTLAMYADSTLAVPGQLTTIDWLPTWPARFTLVVIDAT